MSVHSLDDQAGSFILAPKTRGRCGSMESTTATAIIVGLDDNSLPLDDETMDIIGDSLTTMATAATRRASRVNFEVRVGYEETATM